MKKPALFALASGAVLPLVAAAALAIIMPALGTWAVVMAIAIVAGTAIAWIGHERYLLLASVREQIDAGVLAALKALGETKKETKAARSEADEMLAARLERFFEERSQRDEEWRRNTLAEWGKTTADVQEVLKRLVEDLREHFTTTLAAEREALAHDAELRTEAMLAEVKQARNEFEQLAKATQNVVERHATVIQATKAAIASVEESLDKQRANEAESRQATLADWQTVTTALGTSFEAMLSDLRAHLKTLADEERALQERVAKRRDEAIDAELAKVRKTFEGAAQSIATAEKLIKDSSNTLNTEAKRARELIEAESRRQQDQNRADRNHFQNMLEDQRKAHEDADKHSEQLWSRLLDQLEK